MAWVVGQATKVFTEAAHEAVQSGLITDVAEIAEANAHLRAARMEATRGALGPTMGAQALPEARMPLSLHTYLESHPDYGEGWWKDDKKFNRAMREFPFAKTYEWGHK